MNGNELQKLLRREDSHSALSTANTGGQSHRTECTEWTFFTDVHTDLLGRARGGRGLRERKRERGKEREK